STAANHSNQKPNPRIGFVPQNLAERLSGWTGLATSGGLPDGLRPVREAEIVDADTESKIAPPATQPTAANHSTQKPNPRIGFVPQNLLEHPSGWTGLASSGVLPARPR